MYAKKDPTTCCGWIRAHWCLLIYIILAVIGIGVPIYFYLQPCEDKITTTQASADVFIMMDASKSLKKPQWTAEKEAALQFMDELVNDVEHLQVGMLTFTGRWPASAANPVHPINRLLSNMTSDFDRITTAVDNLGGISYLEIGTNFHDPLQECHKQFELFGTPGSYRLCVLMTDGQDTYFTSSAKQIEHCVKGCHDPLVTAEKIRAENDTHILSIYSGTHEEARRHLYDISSCDVDDYGTDREESCLFFTQVDDFTLLHEKTANITSGIVDHLSREHEVCDETFSLLFLLLALPLLLMLLLPYCLRACGAMKMVKRKKRINSVAEDFNPQPEPILTPPPHPASVSQSPPPQPQKKKIGKAFKWEVDTGSYIRSSGNIRPDFGDWTPESAPKGDMSKARKRSLNRQWEKADGFEYEEYEDVQTMEEFVEEKVTAVVQGTARGLRAVFCCSFCCCCKKNEEPEAIRLITTPEEILADGIV